MRDLPVIDDPWIGKVIDDRFHCLGLLGKGAMGAIYRCREQETGTEVALKLILADLEGEEEVQARFLREIRVSKDVIHPNVVRVLGTGQTDTGRLYFVMELLEGRPLDEILEEEAPLSTERVAHLGAQIARGLHAAHLAGVVHRDLKPTNIVIDAQGHVKVFDFGLALLRRAGDSDPARLTSMDARIGTPAYMSPEYIEQAHSDARSDLYALGIVLYEAATGRLPFTGPPYDVLNQQVRRTATPIAELVSEHPPWLCAAIESLMAKQPDARPGDGEEAAVLLSRPPEDVPSVQTVEPQVPREHAPPPRASDPPRVPRHLTPLSTLPETPSPSHAPSLRVLTPLLLAAAVLWHLMSVGVHTGQGERTTKLLSHRYALDAVRAQASPYAPKALQQAAAADGVNHRLTRPLCPPSWLAAMSWTRWLPPGVAWTTWLVMQDLMLLGALLLCLGWWTPLGRGPPLAFVAAAAAMGAVPTALDEGAPIFLLLLLWVGALSRPDRPWQSGVLLGLSALVSARSWLLIPLWMARRQWQSLAIAAVSFGMGSALTLPLLGVGVHTTFWTEVLPDLLTGDFTGLGLRIDVFGNLAPAHVFATIWPGPTGQILSPVAVGLGWLWGLGVVGTLAWLHRVRSADPWNEAAVAASWLVALVLVPTFGLELHLPLTLPAIALAIGALWTGRLAPAWLVPIGIATAVLLYPVVPLRSLYQAILLPDAPWAAPLLREAKMGALLLLFGAIVVLSTSPRE